MLPVVIDWGIGQTEAATGLVTAKTNATTASREKYMMPDGGGSKCKAVRATIKDDDEGEKAETLISSGEGRWAS